jgi:virginiamycin B lyase
LRWRSTSWDVAEFGSFVAEVPPPLAIGTVTLADGTSVKGFVAEPRALTGAEDITHLGGWRAYIAAGSVWVASDQKGVLSRIDPATNKVIARIKVSLGTHYLAFGYGSVWAVSSESKTIQRIDPVTNTVMKTTTLGKEPGFLTAGVGGVWVQEQGDGTVARVHPETAEVTGRVKVGDVLKWGDIDTGAGMVWLRTTEDQTFVAIDPVKLTVVSRLGKAEGSGALRYTPTGIWTSAHDVKTITWWPEPVLAHGM